MKFPEGVKSEVSSAFELNAKQLVAMQKRLVAVDDGDLKRSIQWRRGTAGKVRYAMGSAPASDLAVVVSAGDTNVRYAHIVEFGAAPHIAGGIFKGAQHPGAPAQPFFFPAYRALRRRFRNRNRRAMKKAIEKSAGG
jgi:hypothetical protein